LIARAKTGFGKTLKGISNSQLQKDSICMNKNNINHGLMKNVHYFVSKEAD